jgi:Domain of unknown function (DUF3597)
MGILDRVIDEIKHGINLLYARAEAEFAGPMTDEELNAYLTARAEAVPEAGDWKNSIVDLLKILGLESNEAGLNDLAKNLHLKYDGSAECNIALHKALMAEVRNRLVVNIPRKTP